MLLQVTNPESDYKRFDIVDVWFASAYYVFETGHLHHSLIHYYLIISVQAGPQHSPLVSR